MKSENKIILKGATQLEDFLIKYMLSIAHGMEDPRQKAFSAINQYKKLRSKYYIYCEDCGCEIENTDNFCLRCGSKIENINNNQLSP